MYSVFVFFVQNKIMSKRKLEDVKSLDDGDAVLPSAEKKAKPEKKYADQIVIKYQPANRPESTWRSHQASYYTLKNRCKHGFFEGDQIPDPPEMIITADEPYGSLLGFLDHVHGDYLASVVMAMDDGKTYGFHDKSGRQINGKISACNALSVLPWAIYFVCDDVVEYLKTMVVRVACWTDDFEKNPLFEDGEPSETCAMALLHLAQRMGHGKLYYDLLGTFPFSQETKELIRNPALSVQFGSVFRAIQMTDFANAPQEISKQYHCPFCDKQVNLWSRGEYAEMVLSAKKHPPDWKAIRDAKVASVKSCRDHHRY